VSTIRVDKVLVGSPTYKVVVGNVTRVKKIVVGTPLSTVVIGPYADIDNIVGVDTTGKSDGDVLLYDSDSGNYVTSSVTTLDVDGKFYPSDSAHSNILIRRSGTQGEPLILQQGEMAYSYLPDTATDGFGNGGDRLYMATGDNVDGNSTQIDIIGGKYFTGLMQHQQGVLTPNAAILTRETGYVDRLLADSVTAVIGNFTTVFTNELNLRSSKIVADSADIQSQTGTGSVKYITWSALQDTVKLYTEAGVALFTKEGIKRPGSPDLVAGIEIPGFLDVTGYSYLDSATVDGDLTVTGDMFVQGNLTSLETRELLIEDKRIIIGRGVPNETLADGSGFAIGDSNTPIATITYVNNGVDSAAWVFDPAIRATKGRFDELQFDVIDCGTYA